MEDVPVLFVNLKPTFEVLERRITERKIELPQQAAGAGLADFDHRMAA